MKFSRRSSFFVMAGALGVLMQGKLPQVFAAANNGAPIGQTIWLQTTRNNNYASARTDQTNTSLDASVTQVQGWEQLRWGAINTALPPNFGPNVFIFNPTMSSSAIQRQLDSIFRQQASNQFGTNRYAFLFMPGSYNVNVNIGFYTQALGLGLLPDAVSINGGVTVTANWNRGNATENFWRGAENMAVYPSTGTNIWAVAQAGPLRRVDVHGNLQLDDGGWASGGFLADSTITGQVKSGSQQQWLSRNDQWGSWTGSNWNMVFVGVNNAPSGNFPNPPFTVVNQTPVIREKPFLYVDLSGNYQVFVPALRSNSQGTTWANTVVLGLGLATLSPQNGVIPMTVADVDGVTIAGLLFDAGSTNSPVLLQVGPAGSSLNHAANPTLLSDVFFRIGGAGVGHATQSLIINSNNVITDDMWLWRADHGTGVGWTINTAANGLIVNGNNVTAYGLFVEHYQQYQVIWNGNNGQTYFFQNEPPYDPPNQAAWMNGSVNGYAAYKVANSVTSHQAWGLGSYCYFNVNPSVVEDHSFEVPNTSGVQFYDLVSYS